MTLREHLENLSAEVLRDLARNENAPDETRKLAHALLVERNHIYAQHPEIAHLADEVVPIAEQLVKMVAKLPVLSKRPTLGAPAASVTTATMFQPEIMEPKSK